MRARQLHLVILGAVLLSTACTFKDSVKTASSAVVKFHADLNAQRFDDILANASPEYRRAMTEEQNRTLFTGVHKKLGEAGEWSLGGWFVNVTTAGTLVRMQCKTKFSRAEADESFVWRVNGKNTSLVRYGVNSPAFLADQ